MKKRIWRKVLATGTAAAMTVSTLGYCTVSAADSTEISLLSHRYAALEYYAQAMVDNAPENVTLDTELTTYSDWQEKMTINLSSQSSAYDITYIYPPDLATFAANGWLMPLDDYIEKYDDVYDFSDIPDYLWDAYTYDGHIYGIPSHQWAAILFARTDLIEEAGLEVPKTLDELIKVSEALTKDGRYGLTLSLKASDMLAITFQCFLSACGGWWFDDDMKPAFNSEEAMMAIDYIQKLLPYLPEGSTAYGSDEVTLAMTQDLADMGLIQTTRSSTMDDESQSKVVGKVDFYNSPSLEEGGDAAALFATAGYSISAYTENDPELVFQTMCNALTKDAMEGGAASGMPVRESILTEELLNERPDYAAAWEAIQAGAKMRPAIPEFTEIMEISMTALADVLTNGTDAQKAMDKAAQECEKVLEEAGYYE
ncbi:MAG: extracellular solute-binding protein [Eubacteriales bacterium]|nr:extracellular solute-binding protein [Eubacteriales bacterium]